MKHVAANALCKGVSAGTFALVRCRDRQSDAPPRKPLFMTDWRRRRESRSLLCGSGSAPAPHCVISVRKFANPLPNDGGFFEKCPLDRSSSPIAGKQSAMSAQLWQFSRLEDGEAPRHFGVVSLGDLVHRLLPRPPRCPSSVSTPS